MGVRLKTSALHIERNIEKFSIQGLRYCSTGGLYLYRFTLEPSPIHQQLEQLLRGCLGCAAEVC